MTDKPWPKSREELNKILDDLENAQHDYNTSAEALATAALAAFNYMSHKMGATGFQAGWAEMKFLADSKGIKGPFMILKLEDTLFPQYNLMEKVEELLYGRESTKWLKEEAQKFLHNLEEDSPAHPNVLRHWVKLAEANWKDYEHYVTKWNNWIKDGD